MQAACLLFWRGLMQEIMLAIVLGIAVGLANLLSYKIKFYFVNMYVI